MPNKENKIPVKKTTGKKESGRSFVKKEREILAFLQE